MGNSGYLIIVSLIAPKFSALPSYNYPDTTVLHTLLTVQICLVSELVFDRPGLLPIDNINVDNVNVDNVNS